MADVSGGGEEVVLPRTAGGRLSALLGLCQPSPRLLFTSFWHHERFYVPTRDLESSHGSLLSSLVGVCWKRVSPP